jgi:two-component system chemotaxis response regulator CheY
MKALIVEDDMSCTIILHKMLQKYGNCTTAQNGKQAIRAIAQALLDQDPFDLICLDIMMPEMDGHDALRKIRAAEGVASVGPENASRIVMMTALNDIKNVARAFGEFADAYLVKPIDPAKLETLLATFGIVPV